MGGGRRKAAQIVAQIEASLAVEGAKPGGVTGTMASRDDDTEARCAC